MYTSPALILQQVSTISENHIFFPMQSKPSQWVLKNGSLVLNFGSDLQEQVDAVIASPEFQDYKLVNEQMRVKFPEKKLELGDNIVILSGGLYYGALFDGIRMYWIVELSLSNLPQATTVHVTVGKQKFHCNALSSTIRFFGPTTESILEGSIALSFTSLS